jgi:5S rRNA maturation endonuclease (ribonuclease M5)
MSMIIVVVLIVLVGSQMNKIIGFEYSLAVRVTTDTALAGSEIRKRVEEALKGLHDVEVTNVGLTNVQEIRIEE